MKAQKRYFKALRRFLKEISKDETDVTYEVERLKHFLREYIAESENSYDVDFGIDMRLLINILSV